MEHKLTEKKLSKDQSEKKITSLTLIAILIALKVI